MIANIEKDYGSFSKDTELLTPYGWLNIAKVNYYTWVAQYSIDGAITFTGPKMLGRYYVEKAVRLSNKHGQFDQLIGCQHTVPYIVIPSPSVKNKIIRAWINKAENTPQNCHARYIHTGIYSNDNARILTPDERLKIAFQADGWFCNRCKDYDRIGFEFNRERKIKRFEWLLREANISCQPRMRNTGMTCYFYNTPIGHYQKHFDWIDLNTVNFQWCRDFIEEVSHWDGSILDKGYLFRVYYNTNKLAVDKVQAIATLAGYKTQVGIRKYGELSDKTKYELYINGRTKCFSADAIMKRYVDYSDHMYQVIVPSGFLVIRRNNGVSISGCGYYGYGGSSVIRDHCIDLM